MKEQEQIFKEMSERRYGITLGYRYEDYYSDEDYENKTKVYKFTGSTQTTNIRAESIDHAMEIIHVTGIESWIIEDYGTEGSGFGVEVQCSPDVKAFREARESKDNAHDEAMYKAVADINAFPTEFPIPSGVEGLKLWVERTEAKYTPSYSHSKLNWDVVVCFSENGKEIDPNKTRWDREFMVSDFVSKNGNVLVSKFERDAIYTFDDMTVARIKGSGTKGFILNVREELVKVRKQIKAGFKMSYR